MIVIPAKVFEHPERHGTVTLAVYFDVPFEIVFKHTESLESIAQIMNDFPEHNGNQVFSTECKRGRRDLAGQLPTGYSIEIVIRSGPKLLQLVRLHEKS